MAALFPYSAPGRVPVRVASHGALLFSTPCCPHFICSPGPRRMLFPSRLACSSLCCCMCLRTELRYAALSAFNAACAHAFRHIASHPPSIALCNGIEGSCSLRLHSASHSSSSAWCMERASCSSANLSAIMALRFSRRLAMCWRRSSRSCSLASRDAHISLCLHLLPFAAVRPSIAFSLPL